MMGKVRIFLQNNQYVWSLIKKVRSIQRPCQYLWASNISFRALPSSTALMLSAKEGNVSAIETLLITSDDIDARDNQGRTALHYAIKCGQPRVVACLLAYGADYTIKDWQGNHPFSLEYTNAHMLHAVRQRYRRFQKTSDKWQSNENSLAADWLEELEKNGIVKISGLIGSKELTELQREFEGFIQNLDKKIAEGNAKYKHYDDEEHWRPELNAYITNNAFKYSRQLIELCCNAKLLEVVRQYYGRDIMISRGVAMRYFPDEHKGGNDQFQWHHDLEDKRLKIMVLLTDIDDGDQSMSYALGTHKAILPYDMFFNNAYTLEYAAKHLGEIKLFSTIGKAGDIFLFDSNGAHRGNRRKNANTRDTFFVEFSDDANNIWGGSIPTNYFVSRPDSDLKLFKMMMSVCKKWDQSATHHYCDWITDLPYVERWISKEHR